MTADGRLVGVTVHRGGAAIRSVTAIRLGPDGLGGIAEGLAAVRGGAVVSGVAHGPLDRQGRDDPAAAGIAGVHQVEQRCEQRAGLVDVGAPATGPVHPRHQGAGERSVDFDAILVVRGQPFA